MLIKVHLPVDEGFTAELKVVSVRFRWAEYDVKVNRFFGENKTESIVWLNVNKLKRGRSL